MTKRSDMILKKESTVDIRVVQRTLTQLRIVIMAENESPYNH